jgi:hypothetical protein
MRIVTNMLILIHMESGKNNFIQAKKGCGGVWGNERPVWYLVLPGRLLMKRRSKAYCCV